MEECAFVCSVSGQTMDASLAVADCIVYMTYLYFLYVSNVFIFVFMCIECSCICIYMYLMYLYVYNVYVRGQTMDASLAEHSENHQLPVSILLSMQIEMLNF